MTYLKNILSCLSGLVVCVVLTASMWSCGCDTPSLPGEGSDNAGKISIGFRVAAPAVAYSRANEGYDDGTELESTIDFSDGSYRIYFFDTDGKFIAELNRISDLHILKGENYWIYTLEGKVPDALKEHTSFSVMALANWPVYPDYRDISLEGKTIGEIVEADWAQFDAFSSYTLSVAEHCLIPFYGLKTMTDVKYEENQKTDLGDVNLLRAVAKVEVMVDTGLLPEYISVDDECPLTIHGINPRGYCGTVGDIGPGNSWDTDYVKDLHLPFTGNKNHEAAMTNRGEMLETEGSPTSRKWIAYLPEFRNIGSGENCARIELNFIYYKDHTKQDVVERKPFVLYFARYRDGITDNADTDRLDIRRNDLYRFTIKGPIKPELEVREWNFRPQDEINM